VLYETPASSAAGVLLYGHTVITRVLRLRHSMG
jgi:hypothetical protein